MQTHELDAPLTILGRELRTSNDEAMQSTPPFWGEFEATGLLTQIPNRLADDVYAVYTNFANEGVGNTGTYSMIIGCAVQAGEFAEGLISVTIPALPRVLFPLEHGRFDLVGAMWQEIWAMSDLKQTFVADFEHYATDGSIEISIGVLTPA